MPGLSAVTTSPPPDTSSRESDGKPSCLVSVSWLDVENGSEGAVPKHDPVAFFVFRLLVLPSRVFFFVFFSKKSRRRAFSNAFHDFR